MTEMESPNTEFIRRNYPPPSHLAAYMETTAHVERQHGTLSPDIIHNPYPQQQQQHYPPPHHHQHHHQNNFSPQYSQEIGQDDGVQIDYYGLALVFLAPALGGFLYGYDIGATSFVLAMLRSSRDPDTWWHDFPMFEQGLLVSALSLGALIGSHIVLVYLAKSIGRRKEMRVAASLYIVGAMLNIMSGTVLANTSVGPHGWGIGIVTLIAGRLFYGAGVGFIMHGAPTYMAEMSPSRVRGTVVSAKETVIVFGIVVGMLMGDLMSDYPDNWTDLYSFEILGAVPMLLLTFKIPRSKRWLLMKGYHEEAKESMKFVYKGNIEDEFQKMADTIGNLCYRNDCEGNDDISNNDSFYGAGDEEDFAGGLNAEGRIRLHRRQHSLADNLNVETATTRSTNYNDYNDEDGLDGPKLTSQRFRRILIIGLSMLVCQQASGQPAVLAYSRVLFEAAGWTGHASVITVLIMGLTSAITVSLVDRLGRKILLLAGCTIMGLALSCLALAFWDSQDGDAKYQLQHWQQQMVLWSMFIFIAGYQVGYGPITWTVLSEIYPSEIRGTAMALSVEVNFFFKFLFQLFFPLVQDALGWKSTFLTFACLCAVGFLFVLIMVPETKGLSLEEIQVKLRGLQQPQDPCSARPFSTPLLDQNVDGTPGLRSTPHGLTPIV